MASLALASLAPGLVAAEHEIYSNESSRLALHGSATVAVFPGSNSWFGESESFLGDNTDSWSEFGAEIGLAFENTIGQSSFFAEISGVYTATGGDDASGLTIGETGSAQASTEQAHLGWRYSDPFPGLEDDTFTLSVGRQDYLIGTGMLIADGGSDGAESGGWYLSMRKAFQESVIASLRSNSLVAEGFYLQNRPRRGGIQGDAVGANLEYAFGGGITAGTTYMVVNTKNNPDTASLDVWSGRLGWSRPSGLELAGEYVIENSSQIDADGYYGEVAWSFSGSSWEPRISYRYADFDGDDPGTATDERFREIAYGYTDYGYWYQGEITGDYPLGNGNLKSHLFRIKATPGETWTLNLLYYKFSLNEPASLDPALTSDDWGDEINFTADWAATDNWYLIGVMGVLFPGLAPEQWVGGDENWFYSMIYVSYSL